MHKISTGGASSGDNLESTLELHLLPNFPHLFSDNELIELRHWGVHADALTNGRVEPKSEKEQNFVLVISGAAEPTTKFQLIWMRYLQAVRAEHAFTAVEHFNERLNELENLRADVKRLNAAHKGVWADATSYKEIASSQVLELKNKLSSLQRQLEKYEPQNNSKVDESEPWESWGNDWREQK